MFWRLVSEYFKEAAQFLVPSFFQGFPNLAPDKVSL